MGCFRLIRAIPTISFIKKESFKPSLKGRESVCVPDIYWQLVPQERGLIAEGSASHSTFRTCRTLFRLAEPNRINVINYVKLAFTFFQALNVGFGGCCARVQKKKMK